MKKLLVLALISGLLLASLGAPAAVAKKKKKKRVERVVEVKYEQPGIGVAPLGGYPVNFPDGSEVGTTPGDKYMKIEVTDQSGQKVWGFISQGDLDENGLNDDGYGEFCGSHPEPVEVAAPGTPIIGIYAFNGVCNANTGGGPSVMTTGTIKITFSNRP